MHDKASQKGSSSILSEYIQCVELRHVEIILVFAVACPQVPTCLQNVKMTRYGAPLLFRGTVSTQSACTPSRRQPRVLEHRTVVLGSCAWLVHVYRPGRPWLESTWCPPSHRLVEDPLFVTGALAPGHYATRNACTLTLLSLRRSLLQVELLASVCRRQLPTRSLHSTPWGWV